MAQSIQPRSETSARGREFAGADKRLKRVLAEARRANEILKAASGHLVRGYGFYYRYDSVAELDLINQL